MKSKGEEFVFSVSSAKKDMSFSKKHCPLVFQVWVMLCVIGGLLFLFFPFIGFSKFFENPFSIGVFVLTRCLSIIGLLFILRGGALGSCEAYIMKSKGEKPRKEPLKRAMFSIAIGLFLLLSSVFWAMIEVDPSSWLGSFQIAGLAAM
ncbi:MAG: hypothetical protein K1000chlam3_01405 [Chlamydiae bacterium]|nr:hypothetical protein [Chlamydiota bacterium]